MARRTILTKIRLTPAERRAIQDAATDCGKPLARYIRETALGVSPIARRSRIDDAAVLALTRIGTNLNQLAHAANLNTLDAIDAGHVRRVLDEIVKAVKRL